MTLSIVIDTQNNLCIKSLQIWDAMPENRDGVHEKSCELMQTFDKTHMKKCYYQWNDK